MVVVVIALRLLHGWVTAWQTVLKVGHFGYP
jgi:hypothetical protein